MFTKLITVVCLLSVIHYSQGAQAPFITKCKAEDTSCIVENTIKTIPIFAAGIPELGVESLDPAHIDFVDCSKPDLKFLLNDIEMVGMKNCKPVDVHREKEKEKLYLEITCPVKMNAKYELSGKILSVDIEGNGDIFVHLPQFVVKVDVDFKEKPGKDGKHYFHIPKFDYTYELKDKSEVVFENLFPNNEELRKPVIELIKNNGNEVVQELGGPMFRATITKIVKNFNSFFKKVPVDELAIE